MTQPVTVIKLGGALLTDKRQPFTLRHAILNQVVNELKTCIESGFIGRLLLVHGAGSFGHPPVVQHQLHKGFQSPTQLIHFTYAHNCVMQLRLAIAKVCHQASLAVVTIAPSSCMTADGFVARNQFYDAISGFLDLGMIPLLGGDLITDQQVGFCVHSGDIIAVDLALHYRASRLIFATAVDGIYDRDPIQFPQAKRIGQLSLQELVDGAAQLNVHQDLDASGAMAGKLDAVRQASDAMRAGLCVHVLSMMREGNLQALLNGKPVGTQLVP